MSNVVTLGQNNVKQINNNKKMVNRYDINDAKLICDSLKMNKSSIANEYVFFSDLNKHIKNEGNGIFPLGKSEIKVINKILNLIQNKNMAINIIVENHELIFNKPSLNELGNLIGHLSNALKGTEKVSEIVIDDVVKKYWDYLKRELAPSDIVMGSYPKVLLDIIISNRSEEAFTTMYYIYKDFKTMKYTSTSVFANKNKDKDKFKKAKIDGYVEFSSKLKEMTNNIKNNKTNIMIPKIVEDSDVVFNMYKALHQIEDRDKQISVNLESFVCNIIFIYYCSIRLADQNALSNGDLEKSKLSYLIKDYMINSDSDFIKDNYLTTIKEIYNKHRDTAKCLYLLNEFISFSNHKHSIHIIKAIDVLFYIIQSVTEFSEIPSILIEEIMDKLIELSNDEVKFNINIIIDIYNKVVYLLEPNKVLDIADNIIRNDGRLIIHQRTFGILENYCNNNVKLFLSQSISYKNIVQFMEYLIKINSQNSNNEFVDQVINFYAKSFELEDILKFIRRSEDKIRFLVEKNNELIKRIMQMDFKDTMDYFDYYAYANSSKLRGGLIKHLANILTNTDDWNLYFNCTEGKNAITRIIKLMFTENYNKECDIEVKFDIKNFLREFKKSDERFYYKLLEEVFVNF